MIDVLFQAQAPVALAWRQSTARERIRRLEGLLDSVMAHRDALHRAFAQDFSKPPMEVESTEILPVVEEIRHAIKHVRRWMAPVRVGATWTTFGTQSEVRYQPKGRCLILGPWNYPLNTVLCPLASAVAAGNTVMIRPSELTPRVAEVVHDIVSRAFAPEEVVVVQGGVEVAQALLTLPFDHIYFTGSPAVGKQVMKAAAEHLSSVTLELGGKSPVIIDRSADVQEAARVLLWGKLINLGQSCVAPDYVYVHRDCQQAFVAACQAVLLARYGASKTSDGAHPDLACLITPRHAQRLVGLLQDACDRGARVVAGGEHDAARRAMAPTVLVDMPTEALLSTEEIFGPILPVTAYDDLDQVITRINQQPKPLALYVWGQDQRVIDAVIQQTSSGGVCVNHCMLQYVHTGLPFGGVNNSGLGNAHGHFGFKAFSHERAVLRHRFGMAARMMFPPYTPARLALVKKMVDVLRRL